MLPIDWTAVDKAALDALVTNGVSESRTLEYKEIVSASTDAEKREYLADVSSFANASGGDIVFGIIEARDPTGNPTGVPASADGLAGVRDGDILRLETIIRDGIEPRISVQFKLIQGFAKGPVLVLRVARGWSSPHMVKFQNASRFYSRTSAGKFQLDVHQIRAAFAQAEELPERLRNLRLDRVSRILGGESPTKIASSAQVLVIHLIPYAAFDPSFRVDLHAAKDDKKIRFRPIGVSGWNRRYNFDGLAATTTGEYASTQLFRNGVIEAVYTFGSGVGAFSAGLVENLVITDPPMLRDLVHALGAAPPVALAVSVLNVGGLKLELPPSFWPMPGAQYVSDRNDLLLPMVILESETQDFEASLQEPLDAMWQAFGFPSSPRYRKP